MHTVSGFLCLLAAFAAADPQPAADWRAGLASVVVTPEEPVWMAGYGARDKPAEGKLTDLFAKALALEDTAGRRLVIVTTDLIGIPRAMRDDVVARLAKSHNLSPEAILLNCSHTHCGPVVRAGKSSIYDLSDEEWKKLDAYIPRLHDKLTQVVASALDNLAPATLAYSHARCGFAMNRRLPTPGGYQNSPFPDGPVDHAVPVLRVTGADGKLHGILFGYACHNTTLSFNQFCGDYAGFAQQYLEEAHPGVTAMFLMGCGGDQNPYPRSTVELCRQHGRSLATAVEAALLPAPKPVHGPLSLAYEDVTLEFAPPPTKEELERQQQSANKFERLHATRLLEQIAEQGSLRTTYPLPLQAIQFGQDLTIVALAGETVVDYSLRLKQELTGNPLWVAGYSNDVFGYVPSLRVLKEGGYEGVGAMTYTLLPGAFAPDVEERIVTAAHRLVKQVREAK